MIVANIKNAERYYSLNPLFKEIFDFLGTLNDDSVEGTQREGWRAGVSVCEKRDYDESGELRPAEAHRAYIDIHYVISGSEGMGYADVDTLTPITEYDAEGDCLLLSGDVSVVTLCEGDFCIVFPEDAHVPALTTKHRDGLKKSVVKVKL
ncbi:MAG: YhcH/YjgK/YiaL family protein [Clostridia bacterium]|nr:YhcH/YjgK/YiaL family protein [Clostridia bacterium]MBO5207239.1 YhcH/YjgK/YiaL family protein [Clostridia bacterium]MBP3582510.1 YhcH/YjgK/YiaL family protein [Clostridia bacterium]